MGLWSGIKKAGNAVYSGVDRTFAGGILPGGAKPIVAEIFDRGKGLASDGYDAVAEGAGSAWDVLSGERDWRRNREAVKEEREWELGLANTAHEREMADLLAAGINPMLAGSMPGASTPHVNPAVSNVAAHGGQVLSLASDTISKLASAKDTLASANLKRVQAGDIGVTQKGRLDTLLQGLEQSKAHINSLNAGAAEKQKMIAKLNEEIDLLKKKQPHASREAEFFSSPMGKHAVTSQHSTKSIPQMAGTLGSIVGDKIGQANSALQVHRDNANKVVDQAIDRAGKFLRSGVKKASPRSKKGRAK